MHHANQATDDAADGSLGSSIFAPPRDQWNLVSQNSNQRNPRHMILVAGIIVFILIVVITAVIAHKSSGQ